MRPMAMRALKLSRFLWSVLVALLLGLAPPGGGAKAESANEAVQAKCEVAEINPVTGHLLCIRPLGAAVEPPPEDIAPPCKAEDSRGQWSWAPNCRPAE